VCLPHFAPVSPKGKGCQQCNADRDARYQKVQDKKKARREGREEKVLHPNKQR
jgi:hypothetical protein